MRSEELYDIITFVWVMYNLTAISWQYTAHDHEDPLEPMTNPIYGPADDN